MRKTLLGFFALFSVSFAGDYIGGGGGITTPHPPDFSAGSPAVGTSTITVVDTMALTNQIENSVGNSVGNFFDSLLASLGLPKELKTPVDSIMKAIYQEILCRIKLPDFSYNIKLPSSVSVPLSCSRVYISFSPVYKRVLETSNDITGGMLDDAKACLKGDLKACKQVAERNRISFQKLKSEIAENNTPFIKGASQENLADQNQEQIRKEYQNRVNSLAKPTVDTTNPKGVVVNNVSQDARFGAENEASSSSGELLGWGKEYTKNLPPASKPYYNYIANKQLQRKIVIQALRQRVKQMRVQLARLASEVRAWCNTEWNIKTIPPVRGGGGIGGIQNILTRCCCDCSCVWSAEKSVNSHIEAAKREIENTIERVGNMIADVISAEHYRTRQQINAVGQGITDALKKTMCLQARLELQRNEIQLLQLEVELAKLQAEYSNLNDKEMKEFKQKMIELRTSH
jgi:hypothetical protein